MTDIKRKQLFTNKELLAIIIPLVLERLTATAIGLADTLMVSFVGEVAVSAVSLADAINNIFITLFTAVATGGAVVAAQYIGNGDMEEAVKSKKQLLYLLTSVSIFICALISIFSGPIIAMLYPALEAGVAGMSVEYLRITALSYPFHSIMMSATSLFRAERNSKMSLYAALMSNVINLVGNAWFIYALKMGANGAALGTLLSRVITAMFMLYLLCRPGYQMRINKLLRYKPDFAVIRKILGIGIPNGIENSLFNVGRLTVQGVISTLGTAAVAAYSVGMNIIMVTDCIGSGINMSALTVVGQCVGAGDFDQASKYTKKLLGWSYISVDILFVVMLIFARPIVSIFNLSAEAITMCQNSLYVAGIIGIALWPASFTLPAAIRAAGDARAPMVTSVFSMGAFRVLCGYILAIPLGLGLVGIFAGMGLDWAFRAVVFSLRFKGGRWKTKRLV